MKKIIATIIPIFIIICIAGCADEDDIDYLAGSQRVIPDSNNEIVFAGTTYPDVTFPHKDHSDRHGGVCATCHFCQDIQTETQWYCRSCHSAEDTEQRCTPPDDLHGCTYVHCYECHEEDGNNPGHTGPGECDYCH